MWGIESIRARCQSKCERLASCSLRIPCPSNERQACCLSLPAIAWKSLLKSLKEENVQPTVTRYTEQFQKHLCDFFFFYSFQLSGRQMWARFGVLVFHCKLSFRICWSWKPKGILKGRWREKGRQRKWQKCYIDLMNVILTPILWIYSHNFRLL